MFDIELNGYKKKDVNKYLVETLDKLEEFENIIKTQREEIKALEKKLALLDKDDNYVEQAKNNADIIINKVLTDLNDLDSRIHNAILNELDK